VNEVKLLCERNAAEQAALSWYQQCAQLRCQCDDLQAQCIQAWATAQKNHLFACHWKAAAEAAATHQYHDQYQTPIPPQLSTLGATHPSSTLRPESGAIEPATVPSSMAVDERSGMGTGRDRDRDNAAAANVAAAADAAAAANVAAAADAAAAALAAAANATKVAAAARDTTQFRAAVEAAAAIAAALVTCQAANGQIGHTAANSAAAHRRGGHRPPGRPGARPLLKFNLQNHN